MYTAKEREQYNHDRALTCKALGITKNDYNYFRRIGQALHHIYENACNGLYETEAEEEAETAPLYDLANR